MRYGLILACLAMGSFMGAIAQDTGAAAQSDREAAADSESTQQIGQDSKGNASVDKGSSAAGEEKEDGPKAETKAADVSASEPDPGGDVIKLKSGAELRGLQVINETPTQFVVEIFPGVPPLEIPRRQVLEIVYDDIDPRRNPKAGPLAAENQPVDELMGKSIDPTLLDPAIREKLKADISAPPLALKGLPLADVLKTLSERISLPIIPSRGVLAIPGEQLLWKLDVQQGATLLSLLGADFQQQFPNLVVRYLKEGIHIFTADEDKQASEPPPPSETPPVPPTETAPPPPAEMPPMPPPAENPPPPPAANQ